MLNIDVAVNAFWQFARCWKTFEEKKLNLSCQNGFLQLNFSTSLGHPDIMHFPPPPPPPPPHQAPTPPLHSCKTKTSSQNRCEERRRQNKTNETDTETELVETVEVDKTESSVENINQQYTNRQQNARNVTSKLSSG